MLEKYANLTLMNADYIYYIRFVALHQLFSASQRVHVLIVGCLDD